MNRENRRYKLTFLLNDSETLVVPYPFRIQFNAKQKIGNLRGGLNELNLKVYNLSPNNRLKLVQDELDTERNLRVILEAGYENDLRIIYQGTIFKGEIEKDGANFVNVISSKDGGYDYLNSFVSATVATKQKAIDTILEECQTLKKGKITINNDFLKPKVLYGNVGKVLAELPNEDEDCFIKNEKLYLIKKTDLTSRDVPVISANTGLIDLSRQNKIVTVKTLFNPAIEIGKKVNLKSVVKPYLNGDYKADSITYVGDAEGNDWNMQVDLTIGEYNYD